ncbi:MAG: VPLPA-CTERM sorting domain-containing protein, partial [Paracoccaceae bacterium]
GNSYDITASMIGRNIPTTISFGGLFQDVEQIVFSTNGDVRVDDIVAAASPVPLPAAGWALFAGMAGLVTLRRKRG